MRRIDIIDGTTEVIEALERSNMNVARSNYFMGARRLGPEREQKGFPEELLVSLNQYSIFSSRFSNAGREIESIMGIDLLSDSNKWGSLLSVTNASSMRSSIRFCLDQLPKIVTTQALHLAFNNAENAISSDQKFSSFK